MSDVIKVKSNMTWIAGLIGTILTLFHAFSCLCTQEDGIIILVAILICLVLSFLGKTKFSRMFGIILIVVATLHALIVMNVLAEAAAQILGLLGDMAFIYGGVMGVLNKNRVKKNSSAK